MTQEDWPQQVARQVAGEVRRYRKMRGLSAQQLADRCAAVGMPIQRSVLANLESGRRETVSVADLLVLARALEVAPALLLFPAGRAEAAEVTPGETVSIADALAWLSGDLALPDDPPAEADRWRDASLGAALLRAHSEDMFARDIAAEVASIAERQVVTSTSDAVLAAARHQVAAGQQMVVSALENGIRQMRGVMRELGFLPPELPPTFEYLDAEPDGGDEVVSRHTDWLASRPLLREAIQRARVRAG